MESELEALKVALLSGGPWGMLTGSVPPRAASGKEQVWEEVEDVATACDNLHYKSQVHFFIT